MRAIQSYCLVFGAALLSSVLGCSKVENPKLKSLAPATLDIGWAYHDLPEEGYSVAAPAGWTTNPNAYMMLDMPEGAAQIPAEQLGPGMKALADETAKNNKEDEDRLKQEYKDKGISLVLWEKNARPIPGEERTRFYVKVHPANGTLKDEAAEMKQGLSDGKSTVEQKHVDLPIGPAEAFLANNTTQGGDTITTIAYVLVSGEKTYVVRFISTNSPERITTISAPVMQTFRVK